VYSRNLYGNGNAGINKMNNEFVSCSEAVHKAVCIIQDHNIGQRSWFTLFHYWVVNGEKVKYPVNTIDRQY